jgi:OCRE domain
MSVEDDSSLWSHGRSRHREGGKGRMSPDQSPPPPPVAEEWPPCFDKEGSAFVFDARSAMFYESLSDFFYDPKSKLYYGNRKGSYFRYDNTKVPPFVEVQKIADPSAASSQDVSHTIMDQVPLQASKLQGGSESFKPKIAINLKTKKIKSSSSSGNHAVAAAAPVVASKSQKEKIANIEKWTEKQAELKQDAHKDASTEPDKPTEVRMTAKGEPICVVCRRKFPNVEKLRLHERASDLHKQNLLKLKEKESAGNKRNSPEGSPTDAAPAYQDRAGKRRMLHGQGTNDVMKRPPRVDLQHYGPAGKGEALDESHVGHKMLQKMGWKGHEEERQPNGRATTNSSDQLRKDWDRIESLAGNPSAAGRGH